MAGNKARKSKESILADAKTLLRYLTPAYQRMPKIERIDGAGAEMKKATWDIIRHYTTAWYCPEAREENIRLMFGDFGALQAAFEMALLQGLIMESARLPIATQIERIEGGISKWRNSLRFAQASGVGAPASASTNE